MAPMRNKDFKIKKHDILPSYSGGYMIQKFLGEGSFGKVALCTNLDSYKEVAVKIVCKKEAWSGKRELHMLRKLIGLDLDKNNLVKFFEHFEYREHMCLVFEMLDISLWDFMVKRSFTPLCLSEIQIIAQQLLVALKTLKNIGLVHTDIKLDNVMLVDHQWEPFKVKLIDFGLAHTASSLERGGLYQALGYRAPEVILGLPLGEAIDMWSLGCVLALMYVGQHLYPGGCEYELLRAIMQLQGQPDDHLLRSGVKTREYFRKVRGWFSSTWRFKTQAEYEFEEGEVIEPDNIVFSSFDDLPKTRAVYKDSTESEDTESFLSLLEQMLHLDPEKRITPREALGHRFITMKHFPTNNKAYVTPAKCKIIKVRPLKNSTFEYKRVVTSSCEVRRSSRASVTSLDDPLSAGDETTGGKPQAMAGLDETCTAGPIYGTTDTADRTAASNINRPPDTNEAASPASVNYNSEQMPSSDDETSGFITVKTRKTYLKRIRKFFSGMMKRIRCCRVGVVE